MGEGCGRWVVKSCATAVHISSTRVSVTLCALMLYQRNNELL